MEEIKHPKRDEIEKYIWDELSEDREIEVGNHLAECEECIKIAQEEMELKFFWEHFNAKTHGEVYWQARIKDALETALESARTLSIKKRLSNWIKEWKGKIGGIIQVVSGGVEKTSQVVTNLPDSLLAPDVKLRFARAEAVRGEEEEKIIKIVAVGDEGIRVFSDVEKGKIVVQIEEGKRIPPLVILIPEEGKPFIGEPRKTEGTRFYAVTFENIPSGEYTLIFEPEKK